MSAPLIWIALPLVVSFFLWVNQNKVKTVYIVSLAICVLLGLTALLQPIGGILKIGPTSIEIKTTMIILGRNFILENKDRFFLSFIYFAAVFWFFGSRNSHAPNKFIPLSLAIISLLTAALAVEPFFYSAVLIELAVIISLPLLIHHGQAIGKGVLRYFIYQCLGMPFILLAGWLLSGAQANPSNATQLQVAALLLGLGFAFWLAVFPFHVWIPELAEENHPYIAGFILSVLPSVYLLIILKYVNGLIWLKNFALLSPILRIVGAIMIVTGGVWAAVQSNLKRLFGFCVIVESGFSLICISLQTQIGNEIFYLSLIPNMLTLGVFAYALSVLRKQKIDPDISNLKGLVRSVPVAFIAMLCSLFSIIGLPLFAGFSLHLELMELFAANPVFLVWLFVGYAGLTTAALRLLVTIIGTNTEKWTVSESVGDLFYLAVGTCVLILMGVLPATFIAGIWHTFSALLTLG